MNKAHLCKAFLILAILTSFIICTNAAHAADKVRILDEMVQLYKSKSMAWESTLANIARQLFWGLALIEFIWMAIRLALSQADISRWISELANRILFIGFFFALLQNSSQWTSSIVDSFRSAADAANSTTNTIDAITPTSLLSTGVDILTSVWENTSLLNNPLDTLTTCIAAIIILVCFAFMAAELIQTLAESYIVISSGVLFLGFGGSSWTAEMAKKILIYTVSVGAKLFVLQLLLGLGNQFIEDFVSGFDGRNLEETLVMIGVSIVFVCLTKSIPNLIQGLINGTSFGVSSNMATSAAAIGSMAGAMAANATVGAVGGGLAGSEALKLAHEQLGAEGRGEVPRQGPGTLLGKAAHNLYKAGKQDLGARITGRIPEYGTTAGRMAAIMQDQRAQLKKPKLPEVSSSSGNSISG